MEPNDLDRLGATSAAIDDVSRDLPEPIATELRDVLVVLDGGVLFVGDPPRLTIRRDPARPSAVIVATVGPDGETIAGRCFEAGRIVGRVEHAGS